MDSTQPQTPQAQNVNVTPFIADLEARLQAARQRFSESKARSAVLKDELSEAAAATAAAFAQSSEIARQLQTLRSLAAAQS